MECWSMYKAFQCFEYMLLYSAMQLFNPCFLRFPNFEDILKNKCPHFNVDNMFWEQQELNTDELPT